MRIFLHENLNHAVEKRLTSSVLIVSDGEEEHKQFIVAWDMHAKERINTATVFAHWQRYRRMWELTDSFLSLKAYIETNYIENIYGFFKIKRYSEYKRNISSEIQHKKIQNAIYDYTP